MDPERHAGKLPEWFLVLHFAAKNGLPGNIKKVPTMTKKSISF